MDELRFIKEKNSALEERGRREEKNSKQAQERMVQLEEKCRELKTQLQAKNSQNENPKVSSTQDIHESILPSQREISSYVSAAASSLDIIPETNRFDDL